MSRAAVFKTRADGDIRSLSVNDYSVGSGRPPPRTALEYKQFVGFGPRQMWDKALSPNFR